MSFTFSTLISMIIINAVFIIALNQMVRTSVINYFNIDLFLLASLAVLIRFLLPFEFPFTISVPVKWGLSYLYDLFVMLEMHIKGFSINIFTIFTLAWCIGIIICGTRLFIEFSFLKKRYQVREAGKDSKVCTILNEIAYCHPESKAVFRVYMTEENISPFIYGIFRPVIILPDTIHSDEELFYILSHETAHYYNHHTLYKFLCSILDVIYFWNPLVKIFLKEINRILEISVDSKVIAPLEPENRLDYSLSLTSIARSIAEARATPNFAASYNPVRKIRKSKSAKTSKSAKKPSSLTQRVKMIISSPDKIRTLEPNGLISAALLIAALVISLFFVFEPYRVREADAQSTFNSTSRDLFYILNDDGSYSLYLDDRCLTTEDEISDPKVPVYDSFPD